MQPKLLAAAGAPVIIALIAFDDLTQGGAYLGAAQKLHDEKRRSGEREREGRASIAKRAYRCLHAMAAS